jgi:hypothetical protein
MEGGKSALVQGKRDERTEAQTCRTRANSAQQGHGRDVRNVRAERRRLDIIGERRGIDTAVGDHLSGVRSEDGRGNAD